MGAVEVHRVVSSDGRGQPAFRNTVHRLMVRPIADPGKTIDVSEALTKAVAHRLWEHHGGNDALNWLEAERLVQELLARLGECDLPASADVRRDAAADVAKPCARKASVTIEPKGDVAGRIGVDGDSQARQAA